MAVLLILLGCLASGSAQDGGDVKLSAEAVKWIATIRRDWNASKEDKRAEVRQCFAQLKETIGDSETLRAEFRKELLGFKESQAEREAAQALKAAKITVARLRKVLDENRPLALRQINNPLYTRTDDNRRQPDVDRACKPLFDVWRDPVSYSIDKLGLDLRATAESLDAMAASLGELDEALGTWGDGIENGMAYMRSRGRSILDVSEKEYRAHRKLLEANDKLEADYLTDEDKAHVRELNDYRMMLGKNPVSILVTLCDAATRHCKYMEQSGQFAHDIDGHPDGRTPQDRAKRCGFAGYVAENILMGAENGKEAVWQWYESAEHHRNMIGQHTLVGTGHSGTHWTQLFAGGVQRDAQGNPPPRRWD
jgi:hypothetical protein